ncbi:MAG: preprotein translocase subunit SecE [Defluviitaleaceae bacterium]|nr:preprotein translocase subunit SecE [Defluviitaleaceae bacterium]
MSDNKKADDVSVMEGAQGWWSGLVGEFKRVTWPTKAQLAKMTIAAIVTSGLVGAIIFAFDFSLSNGYSLLSGLFN